MSEDSIISFLPKDPPSELHDGAPRLALMGRQLVSCHSATSQLGIESRLADGARAEDYNDPTPGPKEF